MEKKILPYLIILIALFVSGSAIYYSVTGLSKMFAGAAIPIMIMATALEIAKLIAASAVYNYWNTMRKAVRNFLAFSVLTLMVITSSGIYGFLSSAYSETKNKMKLMESEFAIMDIDKNAYMDQLELYQKEQELVNDNIKQLTEGLSNNKVQWKDRETGQIMTSTSSKNRKVFEAQLKESKERRSYLSEEISELNENIKTIEKDKLKIEEESDIAGEIGPLKVIAEIFGISMDRVVNIFMILIMVVFDPLAVTLIVAGQMAFAINRKEQGKIDKVNSIDERLEEFEEKERDFLEREEGFMKRLEEVEEKERKISDKEAKFSENQRYKEMLAQKEMNEKLEKLDNELAKKKSEIERMDIDMRISNDEVKEELKKEKSRIQEIEYELTEERAKLKDQKDEINKKIQNIENEAEQLKRDKEKLEKEKGQIEKDKKSFTEENERLMRERQKIEDWKRINWRVRRKNGQ